MLKSIKSDFPTLNQKINGNDLIYLDSAATTQKPVSVIEAIESYYKLINSNIPVSYTHLTLPTNREV